MVFEANNFNQRTIASHDRHRSSLKLQIEENHKIVESIKIDIQ